MEGRVGQLQLGENVVPRARVGGGGHGETRHAGKKLAQAAKGAIVGPEVMTPLADAVRFINRDQRHVHARKALGEARAETFGRHIKQVHLAALRRIERLGAGIEIHRAVQPLGPPADLFQRVDLIRHQRDQRRHDNGAARPDQRRNLVAERLAAAGRQHGKRVAALKHIADHVFLQAAKGLEAINALQDRTGFIELRAGRHGMCCAVPGESGQVVFPHLPLPLAAGPSSPRGRGV